MRRDARLRGARGVAVRAGAGERRAGGVGRPLDRRRVVRVLARVRRRHEVPGGDVRGRRRVRRLPPG